MVVAEARNEAVDRVRMSMMTLGSLFDGIGGWLLAARHAGVTPVWASEIEAFPCSVTARHFPEVKQLGDITKIDGAEIPPVDIVCAGSPCQDLSIAGKREGLDGAKSGLFRRAVDIVRAMRRATGGRYPRFFVWENVPGAFSSNRGMDFQAVLEEIGESEIPMPQGNRWAPAGLVQFPRAEIAWRVLDAQYWGVSQRRKRIFLIADFAADGRCAGEILFERESMSGHLEKSEGAREGTARGAEDCARTTGAQAYSFDSLASNSMKSSNPHSGCRRVEIAKTLDTSTPDPSQNQGGIAILTKVAEFVGKAASSAGSIGYAKELAPTLTAGRAMHVAIYDMTHANEVMRPVKDGIVPTLNARMGTGGNQVPVVHSYCIAGNTVDRHTVTEICCMHDQQIILAETTVRRLTPTECERLQGLPDGYTAGGSDTARYKALGNGMAQPCADYVIRRIVGCAEEVL